MRTFCQKSSGRKRRAYRAAFTLVEVMIAAFITAIIFIALYAGIADGYHLVQIQRENLRATQILEGKIEDIRLCAWGNGTNQPTQLFDTNFVPTTFEDWFYPIGLGGFTTNSTTYFGTITVTGTNLNWNINGTASAPPSYSNYMASVDVTVTWTNYFNGRPFIYSRSMSTLIAAYGIQNYTFLR